MLNSKLDSSKYFRKSSNTFGTTTRCFSISQILFNKKEDLQSNPILYRKKNALKTSVRENFCSQPNFILLTTPSIKKTSKKSISLKNKNLKYVNNFGNDFANAQFKGQEDDQNKQESKKEGQKTIRMIKLMDNKKSMVSKIFGMSVINPKTPKGLGVSYKKKSHNCKFNKQIKNVETNFLDSRFEIDYMLDKKPINVYSQDDINDSLVLNSRTKDLKKKATNSNNENKFIKLSHSNSHSNIYTKVRLNKMTKSLSKNNLGSNDVIRDKHYLNQPIILPEITRNKQHNTRLSRTSLCFINNNKIKSSIKDFDQIKKKEKNFNSSKEKLISKSRRFSESLDPFNRIQKKDTVSCIKNLFLKSIFQNLQHSFFFPLMNSKVFRLKEIKSCFLKRVSHKKIKLIENYQKEAMKFLFMSWLNIQKPL